MIDFGKQKTPCSWKISNYRVLFVIFYKRSTTIGAFLKDM